MKRLTFLIFILIQMSFFSCKEGTSDSPSTQSSGLVRRPAVSGQFYPDDPETLKTLVDSLLDGKKKVVEPEDVVGLISPHAGYSYSAHVAATGYKQVEDGRFDLIVIVASSHRASFDGASVYQGTHYTTPLGLVEIDREAADHLIRLSHSFVKYQERPHLYEHSIEVQLPFIQQVCPGVKILPILLGDVSNDECVALSGWILRLAERRQILLVASTDLSHFPRYEDANRVDQEILSAIKSLDWRRVVRLDREIMKRGVPGLSCTMCATPAVVTVMEAARRLGAKARILHYANSGDVPGGDKARVVGYGSVVFYIERERKEGRIMFSEKAKEKLLQIARDTIEAHLKGLKAPEFETDLDELEAKSGCFVTLRNKGRLRGCIGCFTSDKPLYRTVQDMAISSTQDSRFVYNPVTLDEMQEIEIEISVLSPLKRISSPDEIELGVHGVWIKKGFRSGVFLPQVAHETGWDKKTFLENLCTHKAGLAKDAYKDPETELYTFTVEIIEEEKD